MSHSLSILARIARTFLHNLPTDAVILCRARMVLECIDGVVEGVDDVLGSTLGRVAVRPGVFWERVLGARGEDGGERFGAGWWRNLGGEGEGSVQGEEGRDIEICVCVSGSKFYCGGGRLLSICLPFRVQPCRSGTTGKEAHRSCPSTRWS